MGQASRLSTGKIPVPLGRFSAISRIRRRIYALILAEGNIGMEPPSLSVGERKANLRELGSSVQINRNRIFGQGVCISTLHYGPERIFCSRETNRMPGSSPREGMRRRALIKHIEKHGAEFRREGRKHTIYERGNNVTQVPRHTEVDDHLARKICGDLDIPFVR